MASCSLHIASEAVRQARGVSCYLRACIMYITVITSEAVRQVRDVSCYLRACALLVKLLD